MDTKFNRNSVNTREAHFWKDSVGKEEMLRLKWFINHEDLYVDNLVEPIKHKVSDDIKAELHKTRQDYHLNRDYMPAKRFGEPEPPVVDLMAIKEIMRPVDPEIKQIIYSDRHENRKAYLHERVKLIPEKRYYCPETTSFKYGWNMWECAKAKPNFGFGRCQIIQQSFYRRRGVDKDPEWYKAPERLSPTVCGCL